VFKPWFALCCVLGNKYTVQIYMYASEPAISPASLVDLNC